jgi:cold shock CspA family protein
LAEYLDKRNFQQIDRSLIQSDIFVDQSDAMRTVVDINIDDIGKRMDGYPNIRGNNRKQRDLLRMIQENFYKLNHQLEVLRRGIVIRVNYQLENSRTGQTISSMTEDLRIADRSYFLDINPRDINDNGIIVNFCNTIVSTIADFTHGTDRLNLRITRIQLFYECVQNRPNVPHANQSLIGEPGRLFPPGFIPDDSRDYHRNRQHVHYMGDMEDPNYGPGSITPPNWSFFNRFYHFDNGGRDIIVHFQEVNDRGAKSTLIPCGQVIVNKVMRVNPGSRIIFKVCVWKNDITVVNDATEVAAYLRAPVNYMDRFNEYDAPRPHKPHHPPHKPHPAPAPPRPDPIGCILAAIDNLQKQVTSLQTNYWKKTDITAMREALSMHDAEALSDATIVSKVEAAFAATEILNPPAPPAGGSGE